jgi:predicted Zn-dependent protease
MSTSPGRLAPAHEVVERGLTAGAAAGADGCIVLVEDASEAELRFARNTTTTNGLRRGRSVTVVCLRARADGMSVGVASHSGSYDIADLVRASMADAEAGSPAEDAAALLEPGDESPDFADGPVPTTLSVFDGVLRELGGAFGRARAEGRVLAGFAEHHVASTYLGTSTGIRRRHVQPTGKLELVLRSDDGTRSAWVGAGSPTFADMQMDVLEDRLVRGLGWAERKVELPPARYETLLPPDAVADLVVEMWGAMNGRDAEDGSCVFSAPGGGTRVGEALSPTGFRLRSDPTAEGLECAPFLAASASGPDVSIFDNGMPVGVTDWVVDGRLQRLRYHRAGAARSGVDPTPPGDNLILELPGAASSLEEMIANTDRALLLTCLWYIREVDPVTLLLTGLTRDGVYLVEKGEVVGAVNNFRFNESPLDVLAKTVEVGRSERALSREWNEWVNRTAMPALRVADFNMSSVSAAN